MTKDYHITPEQALEIAKQCGMDIDLIDTTGEYVLTSRDSIYQSDLQDIINAALDKVLGDPVGYVSEYAIEVLAKKSQNHRVINADKQADSDIELYAPRREK